MLEGNLKKMRKYAKALFHGAMLVMSMLVLAGCGRREAASEIVVFQLDKQTTQQSETTPAQ